MEKEELSEKIKKNLLDLQYNKYLQYYNTSIILLFTYFIGVAIAFLTRQVSINNVRQLFLVTITTVMVTSFIILLMLHFKNHQENIFEEIKKLEL